PLAEDHLREAAAQLAVIVDLGEAEILVGEVAQPLERGLDGQSAAADAAQQAAQGTGVHGVEIPDAPDYRRFLTAAPPFPTIAPVPNRTRCAPPPARARRGSHHEPWKREAPAPARVGVPHHP